MRSLVMKTIVVVGLSLAAIALIAGLVVWRSLAPPAPLRPVATDFTLQDVTVINPGAGRSEHQALTVRNGKVEIVSGIAAAGGPDMSRYRGMYVLPGLADMHGHMPPGNPLQLTSYVQLLELAYGVTSVRDAADIDDTSLKAFRAAEKAGYPAPRLFPCGPFVSAGKAKWANTVLQRGPEDAAPVVAKLKAEGFHCIKAYDGLTGPMTAALRAAAAEQHMSLIGHVPEALTYEQALLPDTQHLMGVAMPAGGATASTLVTQRGWDRVDDARLEQVVATAKQQGLANTPTLVLDHQLLTLEHYEEAKASPAGQLMPRLFRDVVWNPQDGIAAYRNMTAADFDLVRAALEKKKKLVRLLYEAGARLHLGTDTQQPFVAPGLALQQEMRLFAESGIPAADIWRMATVDAGQSLGVAPGLAQLGTIAPGAPADLLIFAKDPTADLTALDSLQAVVAQGRLYPKADIDAKVAEYRAHYSGFIFDQLSTMLGRAALRKTAAVAD